MNTIRRKIGSKIYIFCNGKKAEPLYFQDLKDFLKANRVKILHKNFCGKAPWEFIDAVIAYKEQLKKTEKFSDADGDQSWCVFDIDEYWRQNSQKFRAALKQANENNIQIAWSNQCFELWFLYHFESLSTATPRVDYHKKLRQHFKTNNLGEYAKNMEQIFNPLLPFLTKAIQNARKSYIKDKVEKDPSTAVFLLVEELQRL